MTFMGFDELRRVKEIFSYFDGKASLIGYPKENGNGIYVSTDSIYLRAGSEAAEGAKEFLRFLISEEEQENMRPTILPSHRMTACPQPCWQRKEPFPW